MDWEGGGYPQITTANSAHARTTIRAVTRCAYCPMEFDLSPHWIYYWHLLEAHSELNVDYAFTRISIINEQFDLSL